MSVFLVLSQDDGVRAAIAVAAPGARDGAVGYALFDADAVAALGIAIAESSGDTPDSEVNGWHRDLQRLTFSHLAEIARLISQARLMEEIPLPAFRERVRGAVAAGEMDRRRVHPSNLRWEQESVLCDVDRRSPMRG
ncbi:MAG: hypothetical protein L0027_00720 [Candidatus Rokubacteria bacterium]|nr:hypothetical protein [Candidatus Rokubacteria bacterium]